MNSKFLCVFLIVAVVLVAGCTQKDQEPSTTTGLKFESVKDASNQFALDLYSKYKSEEGNMFFSPFSISTALTMAYDGAKGQTAKEMQDVLHLSENKDKVRSDFASIYSELNKPDKPYKLSVANALWAQKDYNILADYVNAVKQYYYGEATNLDFKADTENSRQTINKWVEEKTNNKIKELLSKQNVDATTRLILTNAVYFKANWTAKFDARSTIDDKFNLASGETVDIKMMQNTLNVNYGETGALQILEMDYLGNDLSMLVILPKENNPNALEKIFTAKNLDDWKANMKTEKVEVRLPKFKFEKRRSLVNDLIAMGMPTAFKYPEADFTGISPATQSSPNGELYIGDVIHQALVDVAEYGTEAAAATAVVMRARAGPGGGPTKQPKIFNADHPFIFIIQQKATGNILFLGRVSNPSK